MFSPLYVLLAGTHKRTRSQTRVLSTSDPSLMARGRWLSVSVCSMEVTTLVTTIRHPAGNTFLPISGGFLPICGHTSWTHTGRASRHPDRAGVSMYTDRVWPAHWRRTAPGRGYSTIGISSITSSAMSYIRCGRPPVACTPPYLFRSTRPTGFLQRPTGPACPPRRAPRRGA